MFLEAPRLEEATEHLLGGFTHGRLAALSIEDLSRDFGTRCWILSDSNELRIERTTILAPSCGSGAFSAGLCFSGEGRLFIHGG